ncbi:replication-relaxation family protein [Pseudarthrobacter sp. W1I19]|uniref:replication-relaxation family protein n=1 Tax=Pseudarthrobacter sp. W1I19 TaxID=3042288 RepID=UPI0027D8014D|nr:replication-relaxation family protein [Pseudarthrobacter sp. W1I19]
MDIAETFVRLLEAGARDMTFRTEPWCHTRVGHVLLKPDFYLEVGGACYFGEADRGVEWEAQLTAKMRRYIQAIDSGAWPDDRAFPLVLWLVPDEARRKYIEDIIHKLNEKELFRVVLFSEAAERICHAVLPEVRDGIRS